MAPWRVPPQALRVSSWNYQHHCSPILGGTNEGGLDRVAPNTRFRLILHHIQLWRGLLQTPFLNDNGGQLTSPDGPRLCPPTKYGRLPVQLSHIIRTSCPGGIFQGKPSAFMTLHLRQQRPQEAYHSHHLARILVPNQVPVYRVWPRHGPGDYELSLQGLWGNQLDIPREERFSHGGGILTGRTPDATHRTT